jgi:hypothetical protein
MYNMNPASGKALQFFVKQMANNAAVEKATIAAMVHGQLGLPSRALVSPIAVLPHGDVLHGDTTPSRAALGRILEAPFARGRVSDPQNFLQLVVAQMRGRVLNMPV